jgi:hypothetical protein
VDTCVGVRFARGAVGTDYGRRKYIEHARSICAPLERGSAVCSFIFGYLTDRSGFKGRRHVVGLLERPWQEGRWSRLVLPT